MTKDPESAIYKTTRDIAGVEENFFSYFARDAKALAYAWGWYWYLATNNDSVDSLCNSGRLIGTLEQDLGRMGFADAEGTYNDEL